MSVILRANTDLVYLPDHGFVGEEGALRILPQITRHIHRLDISHNLLGSAGTLTLFQGLTTLRARYSASSDTASSSSPSPSSGSASGAASTSPSTSHLGGLWGLKSINLGVNGVDDAALDGVLAYAKKDPHLSRLLVQGNGISLASHVESIVHSLNSSRISSLSLTNNPILDPEGVERFFELLDAPYLEQLHMSTCNLPSSVSGAIASYLKSDRSRNLEDLQLNGNHMGAGVRELIDAIEDDNFSLTSLGLLANHRVVIDTQDPDQPIQHNELRERSLMADRDAEDQMMEYQIHQRLPKLLGRNKLFTRRVRAAALRTLPNARMILGATRPSDEETAQRVIADVSGAKQWDGFRLLDLPEEVVLLIVRHMSGDPGALSEGQWIRLRHEAGDREALRRAVEGRKARLKSEGEGREVDRALKEEWLRRGRWDKWQR